MKRTLLIAALVFILAVVAVAILIYFLRPPADDLPSGGTTFPTATSTGQGGVPGATTVPSRSGEPITVNDFIDNGVTEEDPTNAGNYYLAGKNALCELASNCYSGAPADDFTIVYFSNEQAFAIGLTKEPLGEARQHAEQFLIQTLGISQAGLCALNYFITTDTGTNAQFAGQNLGFSFCEGAVRLP